MNSDLFPSEEQNDEIQKRNRHFILRLFAENDKVKMHNLDLYTHDAELRNYFKNVTTYIEDFECTRRVGDIKCLNDTQKILVSGHGDWVFSAGLYNSKYFQNLEEFDDWLECGADFERERLGTVRFDQAIQYLEVGVSVNMHYYLTHLKETLIQKLMMKLLSLRLFIIFIS